MKWLTGYTLLALMMVTMPGYGETGEQPGELIEPLKPLEPFVGKTYRGVFTSGAEGRSMVDISRWERALNGTAIRVLHSLNDGEYGGETLIIWDAAKKSLVFFYFTTAGFYTSGTMTFAAGKFISNEKVTGSADGITEVKAVGELLEDGSMRSSSSYLKNGEWVKGHEIVYTVDPDARVIMK